MHTHAHAHKHTHHYGRIDQRGKNVLYFCRIAQPYLPVQGFLVVDEAEVSGLTYETSRLARLHTGLALLRYKQPEGAERRPGGGSCHIGGPADGCGIGQGHKQRSRNPAATSRALSGEVGWDEGRLWCAEVLEGKHMLASCYFVQTF